MRIWVNGCPFRCALDWDCISDLDLVFDREFYPAGTDLPKEDPVFKFPESFAGPLLFVLEGDGGGPLIVTSDLKDKAELRMPMKWGKGGAYGNYGLEFSSFMELKVPESQILVPKGQETGVLDHLIYGMCWGPERFCTIMRVSAVTLSLHGFII